MGTITWDYTGKKKKNPSSSYCGTIWYYGIGVERDFENKVMGFQVYIDTPQSYPSYGDYAYGLGFITQIWDEDDAAEWKDTSSPWSHKMGVTIKKKKADGTFETIIDRDPVSAGKKLVKKFYAITQPGEYIINLKNLATGQCAPGGDSWLDYSRSYDFKPDEISGYVEPPTLEPVGPIEPPTPPETETQTTFEIGMLTPQQLLIGAIGVGLFFAIS